MNRTENGTYSMIIADNYADIELEKFGIENIVTKELLVQIDVLSGLLDEHPALPNNIRRQTAQST